MASSHAHLGFPALQPCCIWRMNVGEASSLGVIHSGTNMNHFTTPTGTVESVPGFEPAFKANITFGADWLQFDPSGEYGRIEYRGIAKTEDGGHPIDFRYIGIITMTPDVKKIFTFQQDMKTVPFGFSTGSNTFVVADPKLKILEDSTFCSNGRIICHEEGLTVEVRVAKVVPATEMDVPPGYKQINQ